MSQHRRENILGVYQALNERYASNTTLQWQIPLYAVPAQAALFVGIAASAGLLSFLLGLLAAAIGLIGAVVMRRIELTARWDRQALDHFEKRLLPEDGSLLLLHDAPFKTRLERRELRSSRSPAKQLELRLMKMFPPSLTVMVLLVTVGLFAAVVGFVHSTDGSGSAHDRTPEPARPLLTSRSLSDGQARFVRPKPAVVIEEAVGKGFIASG